jgi:hypothetical protein
MGNLVITEKQLQLLVNNIQESSSKGEQLNEDTAMNTVAGIVGIFDPTGLVDFGNAISYFAQGDNLFGVLSLISAVPFIGDIIGKPVMGSLKVAGKGVQATDEAARLFRAGKQAQAIKALEKVSTDAPQIKKLISSVEGGKGVVSWGDKLLDMVNAIPGSKFAPRLKKLVADYVNLFKGTNAAAKTAKVAGKVDDLILKLPKLSKADQIKNLNIIRKEFASVKGFGSFKLTNPGFMGTIAGGVPRFWGNRAVRSLMNRSKWYLGFLDFLGLGNFVGPDELDKKMGKSEVEGKLEDYSGTQESKSLWAEDFGSEKPAAAPVVSMNTASGGVGSDDLFKFFTSIAA